MIWRFIKKTPAANAVHAVGVLFMSLTFFQTDASIMTEHYRGCQPGSRCLEIVEPMAGFEPATSSLPRKCSTPELHRQIFWSGRRGSNSRPLAWKANALPTELLPQFSFLFDDFCVGLRIVGRSLPSGNSLSPRSSALKSFKNKLRMFARSFRNKIQSLWEKMDSNHRRYKPADLQSAPFGHSGIRPIYL